MEKNQFYDPYNFNNMQGYTSKQPVYEGADMVMPQVSPYEQQYMYYRYLTQMMDYKIRCAEFENLSKEEKNS